MITVVVVDNEVDNEEIKNKWKTIFCNETII